MVSGTGPTGVIFLGVWQSLQPTMVTRCSPYDTWLGKPPYFNEAESLEDVDTGEPLLLHPYNKKANATGAKIRGKVCFLMIIGLRLNG